MQQPLHAENEMPVLAQSTASPFFAALIRPTHRRSHAGPKSPSHQETRRPAALPRCIPHGRVGVGPLRRLNQCGGTTERGSEMIGIGILLLVAVGFFLWDRRSPAS